MEGHGGAGRARPWMAVAGRAPPVRIAAWLRGCVAVWLDPQAFEKEWRGGRLLPRQARPLNPG